jgi:hypothetical protein
LQELCNKADSIHFFPLFKTTKQSKLRKKRPKLESLRPLSKNPTLQTPRAFLEPPATSHAVDLELDVIDEVDDEAARGKAANNQRTVRMRRDPLLTAGKGKGTVTIQPGSALDMFHQDTGGSF